MKLLIDTVNDDLYMSLIKNDKTISFGHLIAYKRKSDILPVVFKKLIEEVGITAKDINEIYVVNGPGSFMGIRAGMTFAKTMALVTGAKLFGIDNLTFISGGKDGKYFVDAKGNMSYVGVVSNGHTSISIEEFEENSTIDYEDITKNPSKYLSLFKQIENIVEYKANYIKDPQIGGI